ncbi:MAG: hypothetical protein IT340_19535 [Chloroflexi bacterium]|nr:hypothetical protein [Chloroflexota bacterium]
MRVGRFLVLALTVLLALPATVADAAPPARGMAYLTPAGASGSYGTARLQPQSWDNAIQVSLAASGLAPRARYRWQVRRHAWDGVNARPWCAEEGTVAYDGGTAAPLVADSRGAATLGLKVTTALATGEPKTVVLHQIDAASPTVLGARVACGAIVVDPGREDAWLHPLAPVGGSGISGEAKAAAFATSANTVTLEVKAAGLVPNSRHAWRFRAGACTEQGEVVLNQGVATDLKADWRGTVVARLTVPIALIATSRVPASPNHPYAAHLEIHARDSAAPGGPGAVVASSGRPCFADGALARLALAWPSPQPFTVAATLTAMLASDQTRVDVSLAGLAPASVAAWAIHAGPCRVGEPGPVVFAPPAPLVATAAGVAVDSALAPSAALVRAFASGERALVVRGSASGGGGERVVCLDHLDGGGGGPRWW